MIAIKVPPLGESIVEATVSRWAKQPGDPVAAGETVVELDTDKVTVEVPALKSSVLASQSPPPAPRPAPPRRRRQRRRPPRPLRQPLRARSAPLLRHSGSRARKAWISRASEERAAVAS
jgi:Biotin-requiring enzyme